MATNPAKQSWLMLWLEEHAVRNAKDARRLLASPARQRELRDRLAEVPFSPPLRDPATSASLAAGSGLDLSAAMGGCLHPECLKGEVDRLVQRTWHYFDEVMVVGPSAHMLARVFDADQERGIAYLNDYSELLLHVRDIGAEGFLSFGEKRPACSEHLQEHADEAGMPGALEDSQYWVEELIRDAQCEVAFLGPNVDCGMNHWSYSLNHPLLEHTQWGSVHAAEDSSEEHVVREVLADIYKNALGHLFADVQFARLTDSALGAAASIHEEILGNELVVRPTEAEVAYEISLPFIDQISAKELIKRRDHDPESFEVFRQSLLTALKERVSAAAEGATATRLAIEIGGDVIQPALTNIYNELAASNRLLTRAAGYSAGVGAVATTVGLLIGAPVVIGPLIGAAVGGVDLRKYWSDKKEIELRDMYFLWRLVDKGARTASRQHEGSY